MQIHLKIQYNRNGYIKIIDLNITTLLINLLQMHEMTPVMLYFEFTPQIITLIIKHPIKKWDTHMHGNIPAALFS